MENNNNSINTIVTENIYNTNKCWYCHNPKPSIGKQRKNGKKFIDDSNGSNDWDERRYCKKCFKLIKQKKSDCFITEGVEEHDELRVVKENIKFHESYLTHKRNMLMEKLESN